MNSPRLPRVVLITLVSVLATGPVRVSAAGNEGAVARLDALMARWQSDAPDANASAPQVRSLIVVVDDPRHSLHYSRALGLARATGTAPITVDHAFPIASVTKMMTAVVLYQLWEEGRLGPRGLDATLGELGVLPRAILDRLDVYRGTPYGRRLTIRELLGHRSGMRDVFMDDESVTSDQLDGAPAPGAIGGRFLADLPQHTKCRATPGCEPVSLSTTREWRPWDASRPMDPMAGVINYYLNGGRAASRPLFRPGESFHYSDTGFVILGLAIEHLTGKTLQQNYRERIFDRIGLRHTYLDYSDDVRHAPSPGPRADFYIGDVAAEAAGLNISFDWAGGGVVSTAGDLNTFIRALAEGRLIGPSSLAEMTRWGSQRRREGFLEDRGADVERIHAPDGSTFWGHFGAWGAAAFYEPETGISVTGTLNEVNAPATHWVVEIFEALRATTKTR